MEAVTEARKLEVESGYQWKQTKHYLKYIKNQEREITRTERLGQKRGGEGIDARTRELMHNNLDNKQEQ